MSKKREEHKVLDARTQAYLKPGMWIGETKITTSTYAILIDGLIQHKEVEYVPALVKLIEEIYTNSSDEHIRTINNKKLRGWVLDKVSIDVQSDGWVTVRDNGGITTELHSSGVRTPKAIFGNLFSSSNYDENESKKVAGTNGVGSALTNIFSKEFNVTTADGKNKLHIRWSDNMKKCDTVSYKKSKEHFTEVKFKLDLDRFKLSELNYGTIKMIEAKVIAMSAYNNGLTVSFNGEDYKFKSLLDYVKLYGFNDSEIIYEKNDDWEHCITPNIDANGYHIGLINGALCCDGEIKKHHEKATVDSIRKFLKTPTFKKYNDGETIEPTYQSITQRFNSFVKAEVINPEYDSQSKDKLTTSPLILDGDKSRDRKFNIDKKINVEFATIGSLIDWYTQKKNAEEAGEVRKKVRELKKKDVKSVRKLIDATSKTKSTRAKCDLFIFEGDSAGKSFRSTREPKTQGALFLRGKCKQAYGMTTLNVLKNEEFSNMVLALGLDPTKPDEVDNLRFRRVIICTDADRDGDGICGQLLTFFMVHFPKLVEKGMIYRSITPLYVASKGKQRKYFYSQSEFDSFKGKGWTAKYMKGLGSLLKEHYKHMLTEPRLIRFKSTDDTLKIITDWMGKNSTMRKQYLSQKVE